MDDFNLTVREVAQIAGCCENTVRSYGASGFIKCKRDHRNYRRYPISEALKLKDLFETRRPEPDVRN